MNMAEAVAFSALMIGLLSIAGVWADAYKRKLAHREKSLELEVRKVEAEARQRAAGVPQLEERLRVLERIATDREDTLASAIEQLRETKEPAR